MSNKRNIRERFQYMGNWFSQRNNKICILIVGVLFAAAILFAVALNQAAEDEVPTSAGQMVYEKAEVTAVLSDDAEADYENAEGRRVGTQELEIRILTGTHKDEIMSLTNYMSALFNVDLEKGDNIIVRIMTDENGAYYASVFNYDRGMVIGGFVMIFFVLIAVLGGKKGIGALLGLLFTLACVWFILIPALIIGLPIIAVTVGIIIITSVCALILLNGISEKTWCAILGCVIGVITAGAIAALVGHITPINGFNMSEAENLILYGADKGLKISGLLVCGVLISALGAVMDVALGIASSVNELSLQNHKAKAKELFRSGMNIGKDAMGTMANTLILAFAGSSLNMLILVQTYDIPFRQLINTDYICIEIIQSISGAMGILLTVPIVAFISARLMTREKKRSLK
jgi:uncharacterized membrane protein